MFGQNSVYELTATDKKMIELWNKGFTGQMLADYFGKTRNAILGRIMRLRDAGHDVATKGQTEPSKKKQAKPRTYPSRPPLLRIQKVISEIENLSKKPQKITKYDDNLERLKNFDLCKDSKVRIHDLKLTHCRYVVDNRIPSKAWYCGRPIEKGSYCMHHAQLCYMPLEKKETSNRIARASFAYGRSSR